MKTSTPQEPTAATPTAGVSRKVVVRRWLIGLAAAAAIFWACSAVSGFFENLGGGPIRSAADYREQDIKTREAGRRAIGGLRPGAGNADWMTEEGSTSCVDDLGFDGDDVSRKQPRYEWNLRYAGKAEYLADLGRLRAAWGRRGWKTEDKPAPEPVNPDRPTLRWPGIRTTDDHGVTVAVGIDRYTGKPVLSADGGCVRYRKDDGVAARERTGAAGGKSPARKGTVTYDDGVEVSMGPARPFTPAPGGTDAPAAHTYRVPVTVTNRSGAPVDLRSHDIGSYADAKSGLRRLTGYPAELGAGGPHRVPEGESMRVEYVFTAETEPSHLELAYGPGEFHTSCTWRLSVPWTSSSDVAQWS
ncbi:hypothetical protein I5Q34_32165 [Streptomyces sp. AV19]|uniref:hypothetical protein n=1 Tax=Streptomyces sp. AV19 TaxID=2793068 RepID=UPI0018FE45C9|nr:hypothetical protein [Streptomyces sp. AV19]MBH1938862.1 hypothetical protein [Streptomyces sp. AV19]MDG4533519.1 hypothetical protein [Streptomyces sp. AV19]